MVKYIGIRNTGIYLGVCETELGRFKDSWTLDTSSWKWMPHDSTCFKWKRSSVEGWWVDWVTDKNACITDRTYFQKNPHGKKVINLFRSPLLRSMITDYLSVLASLCSRYGAQERTRGFALGLCLHSLPAKGQEVVPLIIPSNPCTMNGKCFPQVISNLKRSRIACWVSSFPQNPQK